MKGARPWDRPNFEFKDICKWDLKVLTISTCGLEIYCPGWSQQPWSLTLPKSGTMRLQRKSRSKSVLLSSMLVCSMCSMGLSHTNMDNKPNEMLQTKKRIHGMESFGMTVPNIHIATKICMLETETMIFDRLANSCHWEILKF